MITFDYLSSIIGQYNLDLLSYVHILENSAVFNFHITPPITPSFSFLSLSLFITLSYSLTSVIVLCP